MSPQSPGDIAGEPRTPGERLLWLLDQVHAHYRRRRPTDPMPVLRPVLLLLVVELDMVDAVELVTYDREARVYRFHLAGEVLEGWEGVDRFPFRLLTVEEYAERELRRQQTDRRLPELDEPAP